MPKLPGALALTHDVPEAGLLRGGPGATGGLLAREAG